MPPLSMLMNVFASYRLIEREPIYCYATDRDFSHDAVV